MAPHAKTCWEQKPAGSGLGVGRWKMWRYRQVEAWVSEMRLVGHTCRPTLGGETRNHLAKDRRSVSRVGIKAFCDMASM